MNKDIILAKESLINNGYKVKIFEAIEEANDFMIEDLKGRESIHCGGSMTIDKMGLFDKLSNKFEDVKWQWDREVLKSMTESISREVYITSSNAISLDGKLINMDGIGNRVASMFFGYEKTYIIVGRNKIVKNEEEGRKRIRNIAAPMNAKRLKRNTPCVKTGKCMDCKSKERICRAEVILHECPSMSDITICIIDEELGF